MARARCRHPHRERVAGPRVSMRWGTYPTQVCRVCCAWRFDPSVASPRARFLPAAEMVRNLIAEEPS